MDASATISNAKPASTSLDFEELRKIGIEHIQSIAGKVWTDYNLHDPGISSLEVLAYAITDLASRANSEIEDIVASANPNIKDTYFTAADILPINPVTVNDFRKILIDLEPVKNAWIEITDEHELAAFLNQETGEVSFTAGDKIDFRGLYKILIEFNEFEIETGDPGDPTKIVDINNNVLLHEPIDVSGTMVNLEIAFPYWDQVPLDWGTDLAIDQVQLETLSSGKLMDLEDDQGDDYFAVLMVDYNGGSSYKIGVRIKVKHDNDLLAENDIKNAIIDALEITPAEILADSGVIDVSLIKEFNRRVAAALSIISSVKTHIHQFRNLCEDFYSFESTRVQEIAINSELEIFSNADVVNALATLFVAIDQFISPDISQYSLSEMLDKGKSIDQIFEGPLLVNGFIDEEEIDEKGRNNIIYTSDLVRIILAQNDQLLAAYNNKVISINNLTVSNFINNQPLTINVRNCLSLTQSETYKPRVSLEKSNIRLFRSGKEIEYDIREVIEAYNLLKFESATATIASENDLPIPKGIQIDLGEYYSIQHHFPIVYGVGQEGVPGLSGINEIKERELRKAKARQFKGYLLFFDQLLANYLGQLKDLGNLFSFNPNIQNTYATQSLYQVPGVQDLLKDFNESGQNWIDFTSAEDNGYTTFLQGALNENTENEDRRNRFLNHLLARFAEEFIEYGLIQSKSGENADLTYDKSTFLQEYPQLSGQRFTAFNYLKNTEGGTDVWDTENVSGVQKRIARKLGMKSYKRRNLHTLQPIILA